MHGSRSSGANSAPRARWTDQVEEFLAALERSFRLEQFLEQLGDLEETCVKLVRGERFEKIGDGVKAALAEVFRRLREEAPAQCYAPDADRKSDFFRDIAGSRYLAVAEEVGRDAGVSYDVLLNIYDKSIIAVENRPPSGKLNEKFKAALERVSKENTAVPQPFWARRPNMRSISNLRKRPTSLAPAMAG